MDIITRYIIYFFAVFGAVMFVMNIVYLMRARLYIKGSKLRIAIMVRNSALYIEFLLRDVIKNLAEKGIPLESLSIIDMNSNDDTKFIAEKFKLYYEGIEVLSFAEKDKVFKGFNV